MCPVAPRDIWLRSSSGIGVSDAQTHLHFELQPQDSAYIECSATGTPPLRICWSLAADAEVQTPPAFNATNGRLELWSAGVDTEADFVCSASNSINGQNRTANRTIRVTIRATKPATVTPAEEPVISHRVKFGRPNRQRHRLLPHRQPTQRVVPTLWSQWRRSNRQRNLLFLQKSKRQRNLVSGLR